MESSGTCLSHHAHAPMSDIFSVCFLLLTSDFCCRVMGRVSIHEL